MLFCDAAAGGIQYDLAKAKQEMASSSVPNGFDTSVLVYAGDTEQTTTGEIIQQQLKPLNIKVKIVMQDPATADASISSSQFDLAVMRYTNDIVDPDEYVSFVISARGFFCNYHSEQLNKLALQANQSFDTQQRAKLYGDIQKVMCDDAYQAFMYSMPYLWATSTKVNDFFVTPMANYLLENVWLSA
jgi:peptide/nickel transport system substrate-binding protein